jgi:hypothetical protein
VLRSATGMNIKRVQLAIALSRRFINYDITSALGSGLFIRAKLISCQERNRVAHFLTERARSHVPVACDLITGRL